MTKRAALILAGGKARRFQSKGESWQDKALVKLSGKPLLIHAIENVQGVVDEIAVSINNEERKKKYARIIKKYDLPNVKLVVDELISHISGPNVAIMSGLKGLQADYCLTLPCDMPFLQPAVAEYMFKVTEDFEVAIPMWPNGRLETLLMVLERHIGLEIVETLCKLKRPRSDDIPRGASKILFVSPVNQIKMLDPELKSFININSQEDLSKLQTRRAHGLVAENLSLNLGVVSMSNLQSLQESAQMFQEDRLLEAQSTFALCRSNFEFEGAYFWAAVSGESQGEALLKLSGQQLKSKASDERDFEGKEAFLRAANNYRVEAEIYEENRCWLLEERALADKAWCESWAMGKHSHVHRYPPKMQ